MRINRRDFLKASILTGVAAGTGAAGIFVAPKPAHAWVTTQALPKFVAPLRSVTLTPLTDLVNIPVASPDGTVNNGGVIAQHYTIEINQFTDQLHPNLPPTKLWGYGVVNPTTLQVSHKHLGGIIVAKRGTPVQITFRNRLPRKHILPVDVTIPGGALAPNRAAVHLHGGHVPWYSDGGPFDWFTPPPALGNPWKVGPSFVNNAVLAPTNLPGSAEYYYPNDESARFMWYHDHAVGITRLNAYAGIATAYLVRDENPANLEQQLILSGLPNYIELGGNEIPLVFQDKIFVDANTPAVDPTWPTVVPGSTPGDMWMPHIYDPVKWALKPGANPALLPDPSVIPEFFGDTMLTNGTAYPFATVQARRYRFRVLNACNARFLNLMLFVERPANPGEITLNALGQVTNAPGPQMIQIGTEGGFLSAPVILNNPPLPSDPVNMNGNLVLAPAERADLIIDFSGLAGQNLILYNDAPAPWPVGAPDNDFYPGNPLNPVQPTAGNGPNTRTLLKFVVVPATGPADPALNVLANAPLLQQMAAGDPPYAVPPGTTVIGGVTQIPPGVRLRRLTLNEEFDKFGRLTTRLGTDLPKLGGAFGRDYFDWPDLYAINGTTEVWEVLNLSADTHPMHFHLFNVQIMARQPFDALNYRGGRPIFTGPARLPDPNEMGWKETVRMNPGEVTTVIAKIQLPVVPFPAVTSPRTGGNEYVWHCHILEHEEHDMMRPIVVI